MREQRFDAIRLPHVQGLLAAIDAGDDAVLPILADALEEAGDAKASGIRKVLRAAAKRRCGYCPAQVDGGYRWFVWDKKRPPTTGGHDLLGHRERAAHLPAGTFAKLIDPYLNAWFRVYRTRSAAFLALAAAMI